MSLINDRDLVKQVIDFTGVQNGKMHPMDVDAVLEFDNRVLILIEVKFKGSEIPTGQRLTLERICDNWQDKIKKSIVLKVEHNFRDSTKNIPIENCFVTSVYYNTKWSKIYNVPIITYINKLGLEWECEKCKF